MKKISFLLIISVLLLNACATKTKKFNTQKENCKEIYNYFTQSKNCLGLNFQTYYEEKNSEYEKQHDVIINAISNQIYSNIVTNDQGWKNYEIIIKDFRSSKNKTKYLTNVIYRLK
tara:strand:+ start:1967 stop:2314 length:348 start_codon:yes stop_codon:yes gene_type:complete